MKSCLTQILHILCTSAGLVLGLHIMVSLSLLETYFLVILYSEVWNHSSGSVQSRGRQAVSFAALFLANWIPECNLIHRYPGTPGDLNSISMASSQLHQYNPDKSLTDYVTRLEALRRRLGAIQSGAAPSPLLCSGNARSTCVSLNPPRASAG